MRNTLFQQNIIENLNDMEDALEPYEIDEFYVTLERDREDGLYKAFFFLNVDGEGIAETESWSSNKDSLIEDIQSVFGPEVDILN